jgi:hypothetical protein
MESIYIYWDISFCFKRLVNFLCPFTMIFLITIYILHLKHKCQTIKIH